MTNTKSVGVLLFNDIELLDFAGPLEVFSAANYVSDGIYDVSTVGLSDPIFVNKSNLKVSPTELIDTNKGYDIFIIPGGQGTRPIIKDKSVLDQLNKVIQNSKKVATVCTGSLIVAKLGYLKGRKTTSHHLALDLLKVQDESMEVVDNERYVDNGRFITSAGVSAGIDMSLYIVEQDHGHATREQTAKYMEYLG